MAEIDKPNAVLFKLDNGKPILSLIKDGKFDWENVLYIETGDIFDDLSASDPFEFVFCCWDGSTITTPFKQKTIVPGASFSDLFENGLFYKTVETDYENQFGKL